ncbi:MAG: hypothetical protein F7C32_00605 [Desulfurococcales archaeon]|nr:hypothetical protein [Desulfurococcales archaeon]
MEFSLLGGFPRSRRFRHAIRDFEEGAIDEATYMSVYLQELGRVIGVQNSFDYKILIDGQFDWHDILRPFSSSWRGVYPSSLLRYFDNNFFYRIPVFHGKPEPYSFFLARKAKMLAGMLDKQELGKIVVPGPVTFTGLSKNMTGHDDFWLASKIAEALNIELRKVNSSERFILQIDEPGLSENEVYGRFRGELKELYSILLRDLSFSKIIVSVYFRAPVEKAYQELISLDGVDVISLDWVDDKKTVRKLINEYGVKGGGLGLGVVDARSIYGEDPEIVAGEVRKVVESLDLKFLMLTTSTWLELIPFRYAAKKAGILASIALYLHRDLA